MLGIFLLAFEEQGEIMGKTMGNSWENVAGKSLHVVRWEFPARNSLGFFSLPRLTVNL
jgi:hypothetical protein